MHQDFNDKLEEIKKVTGMRISSYKAIRAGGESLVIEVNNKWIFRFPKSSVVNEQTKKRWRFLSDFLKNSSISVPGPEYMTSSLIGYRKIGGTPFYQSCLKKLSKQDRRKVARQLGLFLKVLHGHKDRHITFDTGYLVMRKEDYQSCPVEIAKYLNKNESNTLALRLRKIADNPDNFQKPTTIIHGDLNFNNILWDKNKKTITGIIDWSDMGLGIPAMDFIMLADFTSSRNDQYLRDILSWYGDKNDKLFYQVKDNAVIDIMNWFWFYKMHNNFKGVSKIIKKLKVFLADGLS